MLFGVPRFPRTVVAGLLAGLALGAPAMAADPGFATLEAVGGEVTVLRQGQSVAMAPALPLQLDDVVVTKRGRATVRFHSDGTVIRVGPDSRVQVNESATERGITVFLGRVWAHVVRWRERPTRFESGSTIAAIRGTEIGFSVVGEDTQVAVIEGQVETKTDAGQLALSAGQVAVGRKGKAPTLVAQVRPLDAVQWAMYYLPVFPPGAADVGDGQGWRAKLKESAEAWRGGDVQKALVALDGIDEAAVKESRFYSYRASLLLAVGSVDAATKDVDRALALSASNADALALRAIVAVAANQPDKAMAAASAAVAADAQSATARVARSYALQARFDLPGAREELDKAVALAPGDALAWARLAEIRSALGDRAGARVAAEKASQLDPGLARTQSVLGFARLAEVDTAGAKAAFDKAASLDPSDPLARLGLGLAKIREGALDEGSRDIEVAVSLDPGQSLLRSYLGKAYYEGKREHLVAREYELAEKADPKDPTPWLYDAIFKQTTNRPVEALESLQQAIELNDNRAVYRSRLLLDSDLAARSASLGRVYSDLGFQERALVEGWTSVNADQTSSSAHRFLADSYAALPRQEIARVSELLQSQLLQPLNTTPIQPQLAESNLFLISSGGPAALSFNEFNPLFSRNGANLLASGALGENGLGSGEGVVSGIYGKASFSAGYSDFSTDGWRDNADQRDKIANAFVQVEATSSTSVQAEYRYRDQNYGDLQQKFYPDAFNAGERHDIRKDNYRLGARHSFSPGSVFLASFQYGKNDETVTISDFFGPGTFLKAVSPFKGYAAEGEHLYRSRYLNLSTGVGYFKIDGDVTLSYAFAPDVVEEQPPSTNKYDHVNAYSYANVKPAETLVLTVGASFDHVKGDVPEGGGDQFNPKFGLTWNPHPTTTIRAAAFRTLKRTLVTDQTLEPTQVAGFNQFYDDSDMTQAWRYGGAIDQRLGEKAFAGLEYSQRDMDVPLFNLENVAVKASWKEKLSRAYLFATPHRMLAVKAQYLAERFERELGFGLGVHDLKTQRVPLGVGFFHPSGGSAAVTVTYWDQSGTLEASQGPGVTEAVPVESKFWLVDAMVRYRLPKRFGFLTVGATNLFDKGFEYFEIDLRNVTIQPKRTIFAKVTLAVP